MISFWSLCWKSLRATAGFRRTLPELTNGNHNNNPSSNNNLAGDSPTFSHPQNPVTMEISPACRVTDSEKDNLFSCGSQESQEVPLPDVPDVKEAAGDKEEKRDECDYFFFEDEERKERKGQDDNEKEEAVGSREELEGEDQTGGEVEREEDETGESEGDTKQGKEQKMAVEEIRKVVGEDRKKESEIDELVKRETGREDQGRVGTDNVDIWITGISEEIKQDNSSDPIFMNEIPQSLFSEPPVTTSDPPESTLHEVRSHDLDHKDDHIDSHLSDCLQAGPAVVHLDSDAGQDQWPALAPCDETEHSGGNVGDVSKTNIAESMNEDRVEEVQTEELKLEEGEMDEPKEKRGVMEDSEEQIKSRRDSFLRSPSVSSTASSTDPERRVPLDFCVQQESLSENVSTEHVDFSVARQQWKKMEEEVKGSPIPIPGQGAIGKFQGTHSSLYPPTRSPCLKHRETHPPKSKEPPSSTTSSPGSEDSGLDDSSFRSPSEEPESAVEREIRLTLEREEQHRRERGMIAQGLTVPRLSTLGTGRSVPRPPVCCTPTLSISPSPSYSSSLPQSVYHEMTANNVIILEPDPSGSSSRNRLLSSAIGGLSDWSSSLDAASSANVIVVETSNLIIRSASEFCSSSESSPGEMQESTFTSNPFFKLRSISSQSSVEQEIKMVRRREEEWRRQREEMWRRNREEEWRTGRERYDTVSVSPNLNENITFKVPVVPDRSVSSPSSPSRPRKMERSSLSCDHKFPLSSSSVPRRQNAMAQRWEASLSANQKKE